MGNLTQQWFGALKTQIKWQKSNIMASFECVGFINQIKYLQECVLVYVDEYHKGYRKSNGDVVDDKYMSFKTIWKPYFKKYISAHFTQGMLVQVKGEFYPFAKEHDKIIEGYTIIGQAINLFSYPRASVKQEIKIMKESQEASEEKPNLDDFISPNF